MLTFWGLKAAPGLLQIPRFAQSPEKFHEEIDCERIAKYIDISNDLQQAIVKLIA